MNFIARRRRKKVYLFTSKYAYIFGEHGHVDADLVCMWIGPGVDEHRDVASVKLISQLGVELVRNNAVSVDDRHCVEISAFDAAMMVLVGQLNQSDFDKGKLEGKGDKSYLELIVPAKRFGLDWGEVWLIVRSDNMQRWNWYKKQRGLGNF